MNASSFTRLVVWLALVFTCAISHLQASGPGVDLFTNARVMSSSRDTSDATNLTNYTTEAGEAVYGSPGAMGKTAWWKWTAPADGFCTVDTRATLYATNPLRDTMVAVYTGTAVNNLTRIGAADNYYGYGPDWLHASVTFYATQGITYYFAADIWGGNPPTATAFNIVLELRHIPRRASMRHALWSVNSNNFNLGTLTMNLTATGSYSGKLVIFKNAYAFKGVIGVDGRGSFAVQPKGQPGIPVAPVAVEFDLAGPGQFQVHGPDGVGSQYSFPERQTFTAGNPLAGYYTAFITSVFQPFGFFTFTIKPNGTITGRGCNLDGATFTFSTFLFSGASSTSFRLPIHSLAGGGKSLFHTRSYLINVSGAYRIYENYAVSVRPPPTKLTDPFYSDGYGVSCHVFGALYTKPVGKQRPMNYLAATHGSAELRLPDFMGTYGGDINERVTLSEANKFTFSSLLRKPVLTLNPATGLVTGSIITPPGKKKRVIKGILASNDGILHIRGFITDTIRNLHFSVNSVAPPEPP